MTAVHPVVSAPTQVRKRNGAIVPFDFGRIERAVRAGFNSTYGYVPDDAVDRVCDVVSHMISGRFIGTPSVEEIQDVVEMALHGANEHLVAVRYANYRDTHMKARGVYVKDDVRDAFNTASQFFPTQLQQFQFFDKYSRYNADLGRRETWVETVDRNIDYLQWLVKTFAPDTNIDDIPWDMIRSAILYFDAMPSMRSLSQAGVAAKRNGMAIYNCSYLPLADIKAFGEIMRISMAGCGVGWSVEHQYVEQLPRVGRPTGYTVKFTVEDSAEGWADSVEFGMHHWFVGNDVEFDYSLVRDAGAILHTKGGRASGPEPLRQVHDFMRKTIRAAAGGFLKSLDAHDIACVAAGAAVSGGQRRTAAIALFSRGDYLMEHCKTGTALDRNPHRWNANNSMVWTEEPSAVEVMEQMSAMFASQRGEPGIFSRHAASTLRPARRADAEFGVNPCGEIVLRPYGLCNLSIAVARPDDTRLTLAQKVRIATIIGTIQSLATNFPGMRQEWRDNCIEERLLGVDITGQMDCPLLLGIDADSVLRSLRGVAIDTNAKYAKLLDINPAAAITCNKPSGNSSQLLNTSSGIHPRWASYYLRRTRVSAVTPLYRVLRDAGVPMTPENGQTAATADTWVVAWPVEAPEGAVTRRDVSAIDQCEHWALNKACWTEHNPSVTITYQPHEIFDLARWVYDRRNMIGGMAFLPADDAAYEQMPYEEITREQYEAASAAFPTIDFSLLSIYEHNDSTTAAQELACLAGSCDI